MKKLGITLVGILIEVALVLSISNDTNSYLKASNFTMIRSSVSRSPSDIVTYLYTLVDNRIKATVV